MNKQQQTMKFCPECGTRINGDYCAGCGKEFKVASHKKEEKRSFRKKPVSHGLDARDWWILPAMIIVGVIGYGMYMGGMLWLFCLCVFGMLGLWIFVKAGKKGRKA